MSNTISPFFGCTSSRSHVPSSTSNSSFRGYGKSVEMSQGVGCLIGQTLSSHTSAGSEAASFMGLLTVVAIPEKLLSCPTNLERIETTEVA